MAAINDSRRKINEIDEKMAKLFCERMAAVKDIAEKLIRLYAERHRTVG